MLEVRRDGQTIEGAVEVRDSETRWTFTPRVPWQPGRYELVALPVLEDPSGNRIGRAFEVRGSADDAGDASVPAIVGFRVAASPPSTSR
jgi:hypothetical protein